MAADEIRRLLEGYQVSQAIHVAATLGIADHLSGGARTSDELARAAGAHPGALYRLLRALASVEVLRELPGRRFELAPLGESLRSDSPDSIAAWAQVVGRPFHWQAWSALLHSVRTGENAFEHVHGADPWTWRASRPEEAAAFDRGIAALARRATAALLAAYDFGRFATIVDVGGGAGALLSALLAAHPGLQGVLLDRPAVIARARETLARAGMAGRCRLVEGDFFAGVPEGGDAYLLRGVLHDWDDADAARILGMIRRVIPKDGTLLIVERVLPPPNEGREAKFSDLNMLVGPGGRERTAAEFAALLEGARFKLARVLPVDAFSVLEGAPA